MCEVLRDSTTLDQFLSSRHESGQVAVPISHALPCGCKPTKGARRSGRRGLTVTVTGNVLHTRCGQTIGRLTNSQTTTPGGPQPGRQLFPH